MHIQRGVTDVEMEDAHHWRRRRKRMDCEVLWTRMDGAGQLSQT